MDTLVPTDSSLDITIAALRSAGCPPIERKEPLDGFTPIRGTLLTNLIARDGPLTYSDGLTLALCLSLQIDALARAKLLPLAIELEDVLVVAKGWYLLINTHMLVALGDSGMIEARSPPIARPNSVPGTLGGLNLAPELRGQISLPLIISPGACVFSLGKAVARSMNLEKTIAPLTGTRLYYFIRRCYARNINNRKLLFM